MRSIFDASSQQSLFQKQTIKTANLNSVQNLQQLEINYSIESCVSDNFVQK